jgi:thiol:disulfide interchange protein DsbD
VLITLYILGLIRFSKDNRIEKYHWSRIFFASIFAGLTLYMVPGITGKPLSALSGILPPAPIETTTNSNNAPAVNMRALPHNLWGFYDIDDAKAYAAKINKPILIDFTGYACANCRKMEENVWPKSEVKKILSEEFVIASLYVDDKKELPLEKQYLSNYSNEMITTIGAKNMEYEITQFNNNAQPYYIIIDAQGKVLMKPIGYSSKNDFLSWLKEGKRKFSEN